MVAAFFHPGSDRSPSILIAPSARCSVIGPGGGGVSGNTAETLTIKNAATIIGFSTRGTFSYEALRTFDAAVAEWLGIRAGFRDGFLVRRPENAAVGDDGGDQPGGGDVERRMANRDPVRRDTRGADVGDFSRAALLDRN